MRLKPSWEIKEEYRGPYLKKTQINQKIKDLVEGEGWIVKYKLKGNFFKKYRLIPSNESQQEQIEEKCKLSFIMWIENISQALFVGAIDLKREENWFWYEMKI